MIFCQSRPWLCKANRDQSGLGFGSSYDTVSVLARERSTHPLVVEEKPYGDDEDPLDISGTEYIYVRINTHFSVTLISMPGMDA